MEMVVVRHTDSNNHQVTPGARLVFAAHFQCVSADVIYPAWHLATGPARTVDTA